MLIAQFFPLNPTDVVSRQRGGTGKQSFEHTIFLIVGAGVGQLEARN